MADFTQATQRTMMRLATVVVAAATLVYGHSPKVDAALEGQNPDAPLNVIIQYNRAPQQHHADAVIARGGLHKSMLYAVNGAAYSVPARALDDLAGDPDVERIVPDRVVTGNLYNAMASVQGWSVDHILPAYNRGTGIGIAYIDSGADLSHPDFTQYLSSRSRIVYSESFIDNTTSDLYGHGTHVMGIGSGMDNVSADDASAAIQSFGARRPIRPSST